MGDLCRVQGLQTGGGVLQCVSPRLSNSLFCAAESQLCPNVYSLESSLRRRDIGEHVPTCHPSESLVPGLSKRKCISAGAFVSVLQQRSVRARTSDHNSPKSRTGVGHTGLVISGRGTTRAEDAQGKPTQSRISTINTSIRRCSRDTDPESYITKCTSIRRENIVNRR